jgi:hypothetical protein
MGTMTGSTTKNVRWHGTDNRPDHSDAISFKKQALPASGGFIPSQWDRAAVRPVGRAGAPVSPIQSRRDVDRAPERHFSSVGQF